jgi:rhamnosyltransferase subunit B
MKVILSTVGSAGDTFPFIGLGQRLVARGHEVVLLVNAHFAPQAEAVGIRVHATSSEADYQRAIGNPALFHPRDGFNVIAGYVGQMLGTMYRALEAEFEPDRSVIVSHWLDFASRTFQDRHRAPLVTVLLQPMLLRSLIDTPTALVGPDLNRLPRWVKRGLFWAADRWIIDPRLEPPINALRASVALGAIRSPLQGWMFSPLLTLGMWPEFFAPPQPDWPESVRLTGFPLFDATEPVGSDVAEFLGHGEPPIVFTQGTAMGDPRKLLVAAVDAAERLGRRALLLSGFGEPPERLPETVRFARFAPLSEILPHCAALVHHGGIGTTAAGLAAGVPQLITPLSHDQPDQAMRIKRLGVGDWLRPGSVSAGTLVAKLRPLLEQASVAERCLELSRLTRLTDGLTTAADLIEALSWPDGRDAHARAAGAAARDR